MRTLYNIIALVRYCGILLKRDAKAIAKYLRAQRQINKAMAFVCSEEYDNIVNENAQRVMEDLGL